jgi:hypothetical protein
MTASYWNVTFPAHPKGRSISFPLYVRPAIAFHIDRLTHKVTDWERNTNGHILSLLLYEDRFCLFYLLARLENVKGKRWTDMKGKYRVFTKGRLLTLSVCLSVCLYEHVLKCWYCGVK